MATLQELLRWTILTTETTPESISEAARKPLSKEDREFLEDVLKPDAERMREALQVFTDSSRPLQERVSALDQIEFFIESIDNANDLIKIGGAKTLLDILPNPSLEIEAKVGIVSILGTCVQNNPEFQNFLHQHEILPLVFSLLETENSTEFRRKLLYLLSGFVKNHTQISQVFLEHPKTFPVLSQSLQKYLDPNQRLKIIFLFTHFLNQFATSGSLEQRTQFINKLIETGTIEGIAKSLNSDDQIPIDPQNLDLKEKIMYLIQSTLNSASLAAYKAAGLGAELDKLTKSLENTTQEVTPEDLRGIKKTISLIKTLVQ